MHILIITPPMAGFKLMQGATAEMLTLPAF